MKLCHLPYGEMTSNGDKYIKWRPDDNGSWLLCGHVHDKWKTKHKMINVGVDVWNFQPVSTTEIIRIISGNSEAAASLKIE